MDNKTKIASLIKARADILDVETRKLRLEESYINFEKIQNELELLIKDSDNEELLESQEAEKAKFDDDYFLCAKLISKRLLDLRPNINNQSANIANTQAINERLAQNINIQYHALQKIDIRKFDGNPREWHSFQDAFINLVHNNSSIPATEKFYRLKSVLCGELTHMFDDLDASETNYNVAWDLLKQRCNKPRKIINSHFKELLELPEITKLNVEKIRSLKEKASMHVNALKALNEPIWDSFLIYIVSKKLDRFTRKAWEETLEDEEKPTFSDFIAFLNKKERGDIEEYTYNQEFKSNHTNGPNNKINKKTRQAFVGTQKSMQCAYCNESHLIYACQEFIKLTPQERSNAAREKRLCMNCLKKNHSTIKCFAAGCKKCNKKHNTLLHFEVTYSNSVQPDKHEADQPKVGLTITYDSEVLLGTARVKIYNKSSKPIECRVLLDSCAQCNFITESLAERLNLAKKEINYPIAGLNQLITRPKYTVKTRIESKFENFAHELEFIAMPKITGKLPAISINKTVLNIPKHVKLADPEFHKSAEIDLLLGTATFYKLMSVGQIQLCDNLTLQKTKLGWIVAGEVKVKPNYVQPRICHLTRSLETQIARFWEIEEIPQKKHLSLEEKKCENLYANTTKRNADGRYIVRLPFNENINKLGDSYTMALRRYKSLENKLIKDQLLKKKYDDFLREYLDLGHMREITESDQRDKGFYIPHHAVIKENNVTTKLRVVFDASAKSSTNLSLNDALLAGPVIQDELIFIIMRFRLHNVVLAADLQKMYRQIEVDDRDAIFQKILWREDKNDIIRSYMLITVTQGTKTASYFAAKTLQQLAVDEGKNYPLAAMCLKNDFYVDDLLTGANSIEEAVQLKEQIKNILKLGGFELHKWASNKKEIIDENKNASIQDICLNNDSTKLLGIHWDALHDNIRYSIEIKASKNHTTKRTILSEIAQLFDPLGLIGPVIIVAKLIMQELWKIKVDWDESIPQDLYTRWNDFKNQLKIIEKFTIPRQIVLSDAYDIQLHGFCDASNEAYGACIYLRSCSQTSECTVQLICAKSRVAPLKTTTIPRLELCAALLLSELITKVIKALKLSYKKVILWSDSTVTLHWIQSSPNTLKTFVANRVAEIQTLTESYEWKHINTKENPADYISRGQNPIDFIKNKHWLHGPTWLSTNENNWNIMKLSNIEIPEQRSKTVLISVNISEKNDTLERFSSVTSLVRFIAFCRRAITNRKSTNKIIGNYTTNELKNANRQLIKVVQFKHFAKEIKDLSVNKKLNSASKLLTLNPFLDDDGLIRVGGRLTNANFNFSKKFPILLPRNDHVTKLIIQHIHIKHWHSGIQATLSTVRQMYWPLDGKNVTRHIIKKCVQCTRFNPKIPNYIMSDLPKHRVTPSRPFQNVGIDYCGPFYIKEKKFRNTKKIKAYVSVFVCFATKAVHFELVTELTTEVCLEAIKRFVARRGQPQHIYSDNATNFVGAKNEIKEIQLFILNNQHNSKISRYFENEGIEWHFIPPRSPHFGGLWESAVKSFKNHLHRTVRDTLLTYENFNTCIIEIEAILNSRPLTPLSSDPNDLIALTPSHFLIGENLKGIPEHDYQDIQANRLSVWQHIQRIKQHFWQRWHKEYLNELRTRSKWHKDEGGDIKTGTLVTIKEDGLAPMQWSLGRIVAVHPGEDNVVRVATVKTNNGTYKRCIKKLAPLPIDIN